MFSSSLVTAAAAIVAAVSAASALSVTKIVSFGDSLSDIGTGSVPLTTGNGPVIPSDAYYKGHYTNGLTWVENVAHDLNLTLVSYAIGGATTSNKLVQGWLGGKFSEPLRTDGSKVLIPSVEDQVNTYIAANNETTTKNKVLYAIWAGGNDNFDNTLLSLNKSGGYYADAQYAIWTSLVKSGARNLLVVVPVPQTTFDVQYGLQLHLLAAKFLILNPGVRLGLVELPLVFAAIKVDPGLFGFTHPIDEYCCHNCFAGIEGGASVCSDPDNYLIWDGTHPTAHTHKIIGDTAKTTVQLLWTL
ncbi:hypothetical protein DFJ73DRAFT_960223 [Zopfochytrium polystomum]|nr:hypothetical protein DFJ73DRAFT_960223 [Zopfochytrium polystomum]